MKYFTIIWLLLTTTALAQGPTGPEYAKQKAKELQKLQERNAQQGPTKLTGPAYSATRQRQLRALQNRNRRYWGTAPVGPAYAARIEAIKRNQRLWNGTWPNNTARYWYYWNPQNNGPGRWTRPLNDPGLRYVR